MLKKMIDPLMLRLTLWAVKHAKEGRRDKLHYTLRKVRSGTFELNMTYDETEKEGRTSSVQATGSPVTLGTLVMKLRDPKFDLGGPSLDG